MRLVEAVLDVARDLCRLLQGVYVYLDRVRFLSNGALLELEVDHEQVPVVVQAALIVMHL